METLKTIFSRKSVRSYTGEKASEEELGTILKAGYAAPVGMGQYQSLHITVIEDKGILARIEEAGARLFGKPGLHPLYGAPTLILLSAKGNSSMDLSNASCVVENMSLAAVDLGLGTVHIWGAVAGMGKDEALVSSLGLPEGFVPVCALAVGKTEAKYEEREIPERIATDYLR